MGRSQTQIESDRRDAVARNSSLSYGLLEVLLQAGTGAAVVAPGVRNCAIIAALRSLAPFPSTFWNDERSAGFFAAGQSRRLNRPVAVVVTSGTAVGELLPAAMEAYHSAVPLILISADRPRRFRGSGAPQSAFLPGIFGPYTPISLDVAAGEAFSLEGWDRRSPVHLNICLEEGYDHRFDDFPDLSPLSPPQLRQQTASKMVQESLLHFLDQSSHPLALVGSLEPNERACVAAFLSASGIPALIEGVSGIREAAELQSQRLIGEGSVLKRADLARYPVDAVLRIGTVPTARLWRDLEYLEGEISIFSLSRLPFSGLSWVKGVQGDPLDLSGFEGGVKRVATAELFLSGERARRLKLEQRFKMEPRSEPALIHALSSAIANEALIYLGNSLPIREWDLAAADGCCRAVFASRGLNGIDGQLSTFYGLCEKGRDNWAIVGDLTALYDSGAPWILPQLHAENTTIVVVNNGGGRIFDSLCPQEKSMQNCHDLNFSPIAEMWGLKYARWESVPEDYRHEPGHWLIELCPDHEATKRFWASI